MAEIAIDGTRLHYVREGNGFPIFLLHSLGARADMWRYLIDDLKGRFTLIAPDARGHGESESGSVICVEQTARDVVALADALGIAAFGIVGLSMGGHAAMHVAASEPNRVSFLVAADTSLGSGSRNHERIAAVRDRIEAVGAEQFANEYARSRLQETTPAGAVAHFAAMVRDTLPDVYIDQLASIMAQDLRPRVSAIACPTLILVGADDTSTPPSAAKALAEAIGGAQLEILSDANHISVVDQPAAFSATVRAFAETWARS